MPLEHVNRRGDRYFVLVGKTKTGKPKFYCSKKPGGTPAESLPEDFEIHESPQTALVTVRKIRPTRLLSFERGQVVQAIEAYTDLEVFLVEAEGDALVVYTPDENAGRIIDLLEPTRLLALGGEQSPAVKELRNSLIRWSNYSKMMRFELKDADRRCFSAERWCFRGSYDNWWHLASPAPLQAQLDKYLPHLDKQSFFELL
ncbi:MAG TPA: hypothetical protein VIK18_23770 [Pirellulales bacterium]